MGMFCDGAFLESFDSYLDSEISKRLPTFSTPACSVTKVKNE